MKKSKLALLEAVLFTTNEPLTEDELSKLIKSKRIPELLDKIKNRYSGEDHGVKLSDTGGYRLVVKQRYMDNVSSLTPHADLSRGLLRVLSIIAYHEPIEQADIVKVIGNRTYEYVKELKARGLIDSEKKGRTKALWTTQHFEDYFGANKEEIKKELKKISGDENIKDSGESEEKKPRNDSQDS